MNISSLGNRWGSCWVVVVNYSVFADRKRVAGNSGASGCNRAEARGIARRLCDEAPCGGLLGERALGSVLAAAVQLAEGPRRSCIEGEARGVAHAALMCEGRLLGL